MAKDLFGWELIYHVVENDITKKEDVLVVLTHWLLVKSGFRCIGQGDDKTLTGAERSSEVLPRGWNANVDSYTLRYILNNQLYILRAVVAEDDLVFNFLRVSDVEASGVSFNTSRTVSELHGRLEHMIPSYDRVMSTVRAQLINPISNAASKAAMTQTPTSPNFGPRYRDPLRADTSPDRRPDHGFSSHWDPRNPAGIGRSDLDPLGRAGGGGMIFNPFTPATPATFDPGAGVPGGLGRGAIPPGARFDPIGPPLGHHPSRRQPPPDADHLPPPGYDDMFM